MVRAGSRGVQPRGYGDAPRSLAASVPLLAKTPGPRFVLDETRCNVWLGAAQEFGTASLGSPLGDVRGAAGGVRRTNLGPPVWAAAPRSSGSAVEQPDARLAAVDAIVLRALLVLAAYLSGSIPMGVLVARASGGPDPRSIGSGRTGGTNALRALGRKWAAVVVGGDLLKGALPVLLARFVTDGDPLQTPTQVEAAFIRGRTVDLDNRHKRLWRKYQEKYRRLEVHGL